MVAALRIILQRTTKIQLSTVRGIEVIGTQLARALPSLSQLFINDGDPLPIHTPLVIDNN